MSREHEHKTSTTEMPIKPIPKRPLGKTGYQVTIYGLGGLFTTSMHDRHNEAVEIVNRAIDLGINYIDTSALYGNGASELNIGTVMKERRDEVFLASKSHNYTYDGTMALVEQSLRRLQTDHLDVYLLHGLRRWRHCHLAPCNVPFPFPYGAVTLLVPLHRPACGAA